MIRGRVRYEAPQRRLKEAFARIGPISYQRLRPVTYDHFHHEVLIRCLDLIKATAVRQPSVSH